MNLAMNREGCPIQQSLTVNDLAIMTDANEVRDTHQFKRAPHWVDPKCLSINRVSHRNVTGDALIKAKLAK